MAHVFDKDVGFDFVELAQEIAEDHLNAGAVDRNRAQIQLQLLSFLVDERLLRDCKTLSRQIGVFLSEHVGRKSRSTYNQAARSQIGQVDLSYLLEDLVGLADAQNGLLLAALVEEVGEAGVLERGQEGRLDGRIAVRVHERLGDVLTH